MANTHKIASGDNGLDIVVKKWIEANGDKVGQGKTFADFAAVKAEFYRLNQTWGAQAQNPNPVLVLNRDINVPDGAAIGTRAAALAPAAAPTPAAAPAQTPVPASPAQAPAAIPARGAVGPTPPIKPEYTPDGKIIVRGGIGPRGRYWDSLYGYAVAQFEAARTANPPVTLRDSKTGAEIKTIEQYVESVRINNNLGDLVSGKECGIDIKIARIKEGDKLTLPIGPRIERLPVVYARDCGPNPTPGVSVPAGFTESLKLPIYPNGGNTVTPGNGDIYIAANTAMLFGHMPGQPEIAARGRNRAYATGVQTVRDGVEQVLDIAAQAAFIPVGGWIIKPLHLRSGDDSAQRVMSAQQGPNNLYGNPEAANGGALINTREQWPFNLTFNPFSPGKIQEYDSTLLPGLGIAVDGKGAIVTPDTRYANNHIYTVGTGTPSVTLSRTAVDSNFTEKNKWSWGKPSGPQGAIGTGNHPMSAWVNQNVLEPKLAAANVAFHQNPTREAAQRMIGLFNYQSTLPGIKGPVNVDVSKLISDEAFELLPPADKVAYQRARFVDAAAARGVRGLDANYLPAEAPLRSIPKAAMREQLITYYDKLASEHPNTFERLYEEPEHVGKSNPHSLRDANGRKQAAAEFVDSMPFMKSYPVDGMVMPWLDRHISTRDSQASTDIRRDNFNPLERGQMDPKTRATDPAAAMTGGMQLIAKDPALTALLLAGTKDNRQLAEALMQRDLLYINLPAEFGDKRIRGDRTDMQADVAARGYTPETMRTTFGINGSGQNILRGDLAVAQQSLAASANNANIVALRQQDLATLATDGTASSNNFPVGSLQTRMLYALGTEEGNKTLRAMEQGRTPAEVEALRQAAHAAVDVVVKERLKATPEEIKTYKSGQEAAVIGEQIAEKRGAQVAAAFEKIKANPAAAKVLAQNLAATMGDGKEVMEAVIGDKTTSAQRIAVAKGALAAVSINQNAVSVTKAGLSDADKARFDAVIASPANLTDDNAKFALAAINNSNPVRATAFGGVANDPKAVKALAETLAAHPAVAHRATQAIGENGTRAIEGSVRPGSISLATPPVAAIGNVPDRAKPFLTAATASIDARANAATLTAEFFRNPNTRERALAALIDKDPVLASALAFEALAKNEALVAPTVGALKEVGDQRGSSFATNPQDDLGRIVERLTAARNSGDQKAMAEQTALLNEFAKGGSANQTALADLVRSLAAVPAGGAALATTISTALRGTLTGAASPLPGSAYTADQVLKVMHTAVLTADPTNAAARSAEGQKVIDALPAVPGFVIPFIAFPIPAGKKPQTPTPPTPNNQGGASGCCDVGQIPVPQLKPTIPTLPPGR